MPESETKASEKGGRKKKGSLTSSRIRAKYKTGQRNRESRLEGMGSGTMEAKKGDYERCFSDTCTREGEEHGAVGRAYQPIERKTENDRNSSL